MSVKDNLIQAAKAHIEKAGAEVKLASIVSALEPSFSSMERESLRSQLSTLLSDEKTIFKKGIRNGYYSLAGEEVLKSDGSSPPENKRERQSRAESLELQQLRKENIELQALVTKLVRKLSSLGAL